MKELTENYKWRLAEVSHDSDALIRVPDLDCADFLAFIEVDKVVGTMVYYFINNTEILTTSNVRSLFSKLSKSIIEAGSGQERDIKFMTRLFLLIYPGRKAVVINNLSECALLEEGRIPPGLFFPPSLEINKGHLIYSFWTYEIWKNLVSQWCLNLNHDGTFQYTVREFPPSGDWST